MRPKSEGFELYSNSVQNGSPEIPPAGWDSYPEPKKMSGEDRLLKNRADHRSSPNVASECVVTVAGQTSQRVVLMSTLSSDQGQSPAGKAVYPGGPGAKITSVSTGNLCADVSNCSRLPLTGGHSSDRDPRGHAAFVAHVGNHPC